MMRLRAQIVVYSPFGDFEVYVHDPPTWDEATKRGVER